MSGSVRVTLGPTYQPNLWDLRKRITAARNAGAPLVFVTVSAPITSDVIEVAIESGSLYLIGVRAVQGTWLEFAPDTDLRAVRIAAISLDREHLRALDTPDWRHFTG
jgi:hypothetical protein